MKRSSVVDGCAVERICKSLLVDATKTICSADASVAGAAQDLCGADRVGCGGAWSGECVTSGYTDGDAIEFTDGGQHRRETAIVTINLVYAVDM